MIVAAHQPNFLPYFGYFHKISHCDVFVFLDDVQYTRHGFTNRNRIRTPSGQMWLTVPVETEGDLHITIKDLRIINDGVWQLEHTKALRRNYNRTKYFEEFESLLELLYTTHQSYLSEMNIHTIRKICSILDIDVKFVKSSELSVSGKKTDLLVSICEEVGGNVYLSGVSGKKYIDVDTFKDWDIEIRYNMFTHPVYEQAFSGFVKDLSIIDYLFNTGSEKVSMALGVKK